MNSLLDRVGLSINIDGIPLFNSSSKQFWTILYIVELFRKRLDPFVIGIFYGKTKPQPWDLDSKEYVNEFIHISKCGIQTD